MNDRAELRISRETVAAESLSRTYSCPLCKQSVELVEPINFQDLLCPACDLCYEPLPIFEEPLDSTAEEDIITENPQSKDELGRWLSGEPIQRDPQRRGFGLKALWQYSPVATGFLLTSGTFVLMALVVLSFAYIQTKKSFDEYKVTQNRELSQKNKKHTDLQYRIKSLQEKQHLMVEQQEQKERTTRLNFAQELAKRSENLLDTNPQLCLSLAIEAMSITEQENAPHIPSVHQILRDMLSNKNVQRLHGHKEAITSLSFDPQSHLLASSSRDGTVRLWDLFSEGYTETQAVLSEHQSDVSVVVFSSDGHWLASGGFDTSARLWDMTSDDPAQNSIPLLGHKGRIGVAAISRDNRWLVTGAGGLSLNDSTVRLWDLASPEKADSFEELIGHLGLIHAVAISSDSRWLVTCGEDSTARLWDLSAKHPSAASLVLRGHTGPIWSATFSADNRWLITGGGGVRSEDQSVRLWDLRSADQTSSVVLKGHQAGIRAVVVSPDSRWLVTASDDHTARVWDLKDVDSSRESIVLQGHSAEVLSLAMSKDGRWLVTGSADGTCQLWGFSEQGPESTAVVLRGHQGSVSSLAISFDNKLLASAGEDSSILVWDLQLEDLIQSAIKEDIKPSYIEHRLRPLESPVSR